MSATTRRITIPDIKRKKISGEKITALTAYDATMARLLDRAGIDILLVGDSLGMVILGEETTLGVTLDMMVHHTRAVSRGAHSALVVADMPFLTYQVTVADAVRNAGRLIQEGGASAVKLEGAGPALEVVQRLTQIGIPVIGHLGFTPQSVHQLGGFGRQAASDARTILAEAQALERAGAFAIVLECIPSQWAAEVTAALTVPTIGIGAGPSCDGQVLVSYDALGLFDAFVPRFVKQYANLGELVIKATREYVEEVRSGRFPAAEANELRMRGRHAG